MRAHSTSERIYLHVPFEEREEVARLGARWDAQRKVWYIESEADPAPFKRWLSGVEPTGFAIESLCACIAATRIFCWRCNAQTEVICVYCDRGLIGQEPHLDFGVSSISAVNTVLAEQLRAWPTFRWRFDRSLGRRVLTNHCEACGAPQSDESLHCEPGGAFFLIGRENREIRFISVSGCAQLDGDEGFGA